MALKKTIQIEGKSTVLTLYGSHSKGLEMVVIPDAYFRVEEVSGSKKLLTCIVSINADAGSGMRVKHQFEPTMNGGNFIAQAYLHLKTLPEFANAVDC
jgi:hypothetical protein